MITLLDQVLVYTQLEKAARKMATSPAIADNPVPDWARRNGEIFRTAAARGADRSKRTRSFEGILAEQKQQGNTYLQGRAGGVAGAAMARADLSEEDGQGSIDPPTYLPPASYYEDVRNHADIAATMLATARHQVGFEPSLVGQELTAQQMEEFSNKFYKWSMELDNYWPYLDIQGSGVLALWFHSGDESLIEQDISQFLAKFWGLNGEVVEKWRQSLTGMVKAASAYVTQHGSNVRQVSCQTDVLDTSGKSNLIQPLTFGRTAQSEYLGKYDSLLTTGMTYLVNSDAIIKDAEVFAQNGVHIFGAKAYCAYVNNGQ